MEAEIQSSRRNRLQNHIWKMQSKILLKDAENQFPNHRCKTHKIGAFLFQEFMFSY